MNEKFLRLTAAAFVVLLCAGCASGGDEWITERMIITFDIWDCRGDVPVKSTPQNDPLYPLIMRVDMDEAAQNLKQTLPEK